MRLRAGVAAGLAIVALMAVVLVTSQPTQHPQALTSPAHQGSQPAHEVDSSANATTTTALSVSEFIEHRDLGDLGSGSIVLQGYWSYVSLPRTCVPSLPVPGALEIACHDGESGITELDEPILTITRDLRMIHTEGPAITPFVGPRFERRLFGLPFIHDQSYPPVPIVVQGHVNDPRASECRVKARQLCLDRFVIDEIVEFAPDSVPTSVIASAS